MAGGFPMFPVLAVGAMAVAAAFRHASMPGRGWASAAATLRTATLALGLAGMGIDVGVVARHLGGAEVEAMHLMQIATVGGGEAIGPLVLAGLLVGLSALTASAGDLRDARDVPA